MRYIYIYIYMYMQSDIIFVEKCECECKKLFWQKSECGCKKLEKMGYPPFPQQNTYVTQDSSPKIFLLDFLAAPEISLGHSCFTSLFSSFFVLIGCTFISSLTFSKKEDSRNSFAPISHGSMQIRNFHLTLLSFSLKESARKLP